MGFTRRLVRHATPRSVRRAMHPIRTVRIAATPRSVRRASYAAYAVTNPLGATENRLISAAFRSNKNSNSRTTFSPSDQFITGSGVRADEGADSAERMATLMSVARQRFEPAKREVIPLPAQRDPKIWFKPEWNIRRKTLHFWQREALGKLKTETYEYAHRRSQADFHIALEMQAEEQRKLDKEWSKLKDGDPKTVELALKHAFADNLASVLVAKVDPPEAIIFLSIPNISVFPDKRMNATPTGRLSAKKWTNQEKQQAYAELIGAHLVATLREGFAVAPSLHQIRVIGVLTGTSISLGFFFDIDASRHSGRWGDDNYGYLILQRSPLGLHRKGKSEEIFLRKRQELRQIPVS